MPRYRPRVGLVKTTYSFFKFNRQITDKGIPGQKDTHRKSKKKMVKQEL